MNLAARWIINAAVMWVGVHAHAEAPAAERDGLRYWPQWRGPLGNGVAPHADPPVQWGDGKNIRWKVELPGKGHSTPIVWGDRLFMTAAVPFGPELPARYADVPGAHDNGAVTHQHEFIVMAVNRNDGAIVWRTTVAKDLPHEAGHLTGTLANHSPVTDGRYVYSFFGSRGLYAVDINGRIVWKVDFGRMDTYHAHGEGASPALHGDTLIVNWDHQGQSFIAAIDTQTGKERWRTARDEPTSWSTPLVVEHGGRMQVVVPGTKRMRGYDLADGRVIWECGGLSTNIVASPVAYDGLVIAGFSYEKRGIIAVRLDGANGDITDGDQVAWFRNRGAPYVPSPLLYDDVLYVHQHYQGVVTRIDARTGEDRPGAFRLAGIRDVYASPVGAAGRIYVADLDGTVVVFAHGDDPKVLAVNQLDDVFAATPVLVGRDLFLRGERHLYRITEPPPQ